ncbi:MAG TPA: hypothetical protein PLG77_09060 [Burkholderiaceae bacterium]|nr:hypothetical protein [Burkholderiaceae bacterium]
MAVSPLAHARKPIIQDDAASPRGQGPLVASIMYAPELLAVVEVPRDERVRCQAAGCNHPVFRRIHVVREGAAISVYGSECFKRLFAEQPVAASSPRYGSADGRHLTDEERQLLIENTGRLIQQFEVEYQSELAHRAELAAAKAARLRQPSPAPLPSHRQPEPAPAPSSEPTVAERRVAEAQAKLNVRAKYNVDPELPGWRGLVLAEMQVLLSNKEG